MPSRPWVGSWSKRRSMVWRELLMQVLVWISKSSFAMVGRLPSVGNKCAPCATNFPHDETSCRRKLLNFDHCSVVPIPRRRQRKLTLRYLGVFANVALRHRAQGTQHV